MVGLRAEDAELVTGYVTFLEYLIIKVLKVYNFKFKLDSCFDYPSLQDLVVHCKGSSVSEVHW